MKKCDKCSKEFKPRRKGNNQHFCSRKCYWIHRKDNKMYPPSRKGIKLSEKHKKTISDFMKLRPRIYGRTPWNKGLKGYKTKPASTERRIKIRLVLRGKSRPKYSGENASNWRGGLTPKNKIIRNSIQYREWREKVFQRDNYTCQECHIRGGILNADHIKPFSIFIEDRFKVENGRTLCKSCHEETDTFGYKMNIIIKKLLL